MFEFLKKYRRKAPAAKSIGGIKVNDQRREKTDLEAVAVENDDPMIRMMVNAAFTGGAVVGRVDDDGRLTIKDA